MTHALSRRSVGSLFVFSCLSLATLCAPLTALAFSGQGEGTQTYPYRVTTCAQLQEIGSGDESAYYAVTSDIDCAATSGWNFGLGFDPISDFTGHFDGRNHAISGLVINRPTTDYVGVFSHATNASIKNVNLTNQSIAGQNYVGGLAGVLTGTDVQSVSVSGTVIGNIEVGGLAAQIFTGSTVSRVETHGTVTDTGAYGGGISAFLLDSSVSDSYSDEVLNGANSSGGLFGDVISQDVDTFATRSYFSGSVTDANYKSSFVGLYGDVGHSFTMQDNFTIGNLPAGGMGAMLARSDSTDPIFINNWYDETLVGIDHCIPSGDVAGCSGVTSTDPFKNTTTTAPLSNWDFSSVWQLTSNYPALRPAVLDALADLSAPGAVTGLSGTQHGTTVNVSWATPSLDGGSPITNYAVEYAENGGGYTLFDHTSSTDVALDVTGLHIGSTYTFRVSAINDIGTGTSTVSDPVVMRTTGDIKVTIANEARLPVVGATVQVYCDDSEQIGTLGITDASGTVEGDPRGAASCASTDNVRFTISGSFQTQVVPFLGTSPQLYRSDIDPNATSTYHDGSTNVYDIGIENTGTYNVKFWNMSSEDETNIPFPTRAPDFTDTTATVRENFGDDASPRSGIQNDNYDVLYTKTVTLADGWYEFDSASDDGNRVVVDGVTINGDGWFPQGYGAFYVKKVHLTAGSHTIQLQFFENGGGSIVQFSFYPIDVPLSPSVTIATPVSSPVNDRAHPSLSIHTTIGGGVVFSGGCTSTESISVGSGTSTITMDKLPDGTYASCSLTVTDHTTDLTASVAIPSFTVAPPVTHHLNSCEELDAIDTTSTWYADNFVLDSDIDCTAVDFHPLDWDNNFIGNFDGAGHTISNLTISRSGSGNIGIFRSTDGATIENLTLAGGAVLGGYNVGALAGVAYNTTLRHITSDLSVTANEDWETGGLVGFAEFSNNLANTWSDLNASATQEGYGYVGGVVGELEVYNATTSLTLDDVHATGTISVTSEGNLYYSGGLIGYLYANGSDNVTSTILIQNSTASVDMNGGNGWSIGGFIGEVTADGSGGPSMISIVHALASGHITGGGAVGGFIGQAMDEDDGSSVSLSVTQSTSTGNVEGSNQSIGGFLGYAQVYSESSNRLDMHFSSDAALGDVIGDRGVGGFLGGTEGEGPAISMYGEGGKGGLFIDNSYAAGAVTGGTDGGGLTGGFVGYLDCFSESVVAPVACSLHQDYATGAVNGRGLVGGFAGELFGDLSVRDSYATGDVTANSQVGGFAGDVRADSSFLQVSNVYASSTVRTSGESPDSIGGFAGSFEHDGGAVDSSHVFAVTDLEDPSEDASNMGWMVGDLEGMTPSDYRYSALSDVSTTCVGDVADASSYCSSQVSPTAFYQISTDPLNSWNFNQIWAAHVATYPTLQMHPASYAMGLTISHIVVTPANTSAQVTWTTDEEASSRVDYAPDTSYASTTGEMDSATHVTSHSQTLTDLVACTTYIYEVSSQGISGFRTQQAELTFTTTGCVGGAMTESQSSQTVTNSGGTTNLTQGTQTITVTLPEDFSTTTSQVEIQIKALDSGTVLGVLGLPAGFSSVGDVTFDVKALIDSTTLLDSFDAPITIVLHYSDADVASITESSLWVYHYHNGAWSALDNCVIDASANTITCTTPSFSTFSLFGTPVRRSSGGGGGGGGGGTGVSPSGVVTSVGSRLPIDFRLNDGSGATMNPLLQVTFSVDPATVRGYSLSLDPAMKNSSLQMYTPTTTFQLPNTPGQYTVYARLFSSAGYSSSLLSHTIQFGAVATSGTSVSSGTQNSTTTSLCAPMTFARSLKQGSTGDDVKALQQFLNANGFVIAKSGTGSKGKESTSFGAATKKMLQAFQKAHALATDGQLTGKTLTFLQSLLPKVTCPVKAGAPTAKTSSAPKPLFTRLLKQGSTGADVKALQQFLNVNGFLIAKSGSGSKGNESMNFVAATKKALQAFQDAHTLPASGQLDDATLKLVISLTSHS